MCKVGAVLTSQMWEVHEGPCVILATSRHAPSCLSGLQFPPLQTRDLDQVGSGQLRRASGRGLQEVQHLEGQRKPPTPTGLLCQELLCDLEQLLPALHRPGGSGDW